MADQQVANQRLELPQGARRGASNKSDTISIATRGAKGYAFRSYLDSRFPGMSSVDQLEKLIEADVFGSPANGKLWKSTIAATEDFMAKQEKETANKGG